MTERAGVGRRRAGAAASARPTTTTTAGSTCSSPTSAPTGSTGTGATAPSSRSPSAPGSPTRAGARARPSSTPTATATSTSTSPTTSTPRWTTSSRPGGRPTWREKVKVLAGPFGLRGGRDHFYRNNGDGTFRDATDEAGMTDTAESYGLGVLASDLDNDGDIDVYVANDSNPNFLYRNNGDGTFTEIGAWSGAGLSGEGVAQAGMGVDAADFDGDGLPGDLRHQLRPGHGHPLPATRASSSSTTSAPRMRPQGDHLRGPEVGLRLLRLRPRRRRSTSSIVNGHIYPQVDPAPELHESYRQRPFLLRNDAGRLDRRLAAGRARDAGRGLGPGPGGRATTTTTATSTCSSRRSTRPRSCSATTRRGRATGSSSGCSTATAAPPIGARAVAHRRRQVRRLRELRSGSSYQSQNALELHFGLGPAAKVDARGGLLAGGPDELPPRPGRRPHGHGPRANRPVTVPTV